MFTSEECQNQGKGDNVSQVLLLFVSPFCYAIWLIFVQPALHRSNKYGEFLLLICSYSLTSVTLFYFLKIAAVQLNCRRTNHATLIQYPPTVLKANASGRLLAGATNTALPAARVKLQSNRTESDMVSAFKHWGHGLATRGLLPVLTPAGNGM